MRTPKKARASRPSRSNAFDGGASDGGARPARALTAFDLACRWLARAARSENEIRLRLAGLGFSDRAVDDAVTRLRAQRFVDDGRLASGRARTLAARGYGDGWIRADLRQRGFTMSQLHAMVNVLRDDFRTRLFEATGGGGHLQLLTDGREIYAKTSTGEFFNVLKAPAQPLLVVGNEGLLKELGGKVRKRKAKARRRI